MRTALKSLPEEHLTKLVLTETEFKQSRIEEHEIKVGGRMYDIARAQVAGGKVIVWCLHDEAEDNLLAFLDAVSTRAHQDTKPVPQSIQQFLALTFIVTEFHFVFLTTATSLETAIQPLPAYTTELSVLCPPPQKAGIAFR